MEHMDSSKQASVPLSGTFVVDTDTFAMESFAAAHQQSMAHMAEKNAAALIAAVDKISETVTSLPIFGTYQIGC